MILKFDQHVKQIQENIQIYNLGHPVFKEYIKILDICC